MSTLDLAKLGAVNVKIINADKTTKTGFLILTNIVLPPKNYLSEY